MSSESDAAFRVTLGCTNCGDEWDREFPARTEVQEHSGRVVFGSIDCDAWVGQCDDGCCGRIGCGTCELKGTVRIRDREPVDDDKGGADA